MESIRDFSKTALSLDLPSLLRVQLSSFRSFLDKGIGEILSKVFPVDTKNVRIEYVSYRVEDPARTIEDCLTVGATYEARVTAKFRIVYKGTGELKEQEVYIADVPLMLQDGTFVINGRKRVVVQQLIRSPGVFFQTSKDPDTGFKNYLVTIIPDRGNWMEVEVGKDYAIYIRLKKAMRKIPITTVLQAVGLSEQEISAIFQREMTIEILTSSPFSYELALGKKIVEDIKTDAGELIAKKGSQFTEEIPKKLLSKNIEKYTVKVYGTDYWIEQTLKKDRSHSCDDAKVEIYKIFHPRERVTIEAAQELVSGLLQDPQRNEYYPISRYKINKKFGKKSESKILEKDDYIDIINYLLDIREGLKQEDDIDSLSNRRVRTVGELVSEEFEKGIVRVHRNAKDAISIRRPEDVRLSEVINAKPVSAQLRQFFGASQLSQFMEETNPLASLTHKRRLTSLGAGGLHRKRAGIEVRDVHSSHYGRICPIETPEGQNIGLINSLTTYSGINEYGFITSPYRVVENGRAKGEYVELTADEEENYIIAQANTRLDSEGRIVDDFVIARERTASGEILPRPVPKEKVQLMDISPQQIISASASLIPFLEHDDANRALMGCNMQRQAVPLLEPELPRVSTGMEGRIALDNLDLPTAEEDGIISYVDASQVRIVPKHSETEEVSIYREAKELKVNLLNRLKQRELALVNIKPAISDYEKLIGERIDPQILDRLISKGIEEISIVEMDRTQKIPLTNCLEAEKNTEIEGAVATESVSSKKGKPIVEAGQRITETILNRLMNASVRFVKVATDNGVEERSVFNLVLTPTGKSLIGKTLLATLTNTKRTTLVTPITEDLLFDLYSKGVTDLLLFSAADVEVFSLGKINLEVSDRVVAKDYFDPDKNQLIVKKDELLSLSKLHRLAEAGINRILVKKEKVRYLRKFQRTNQDTCRNERPIVRKGQLVKSTDAIAEGYATKSGQLALGINVLVAYVSWYGYNYQDAIVISRKLVSEDKLTSVHIKEYTVEVHETEQGPEELRPDPPDVSRESKRFLDERGIVKVGSKVKPGDILVGKITPFPEEEETNEAKLFRALFNNKPGNIKNSSFKVPPGEGGVVIDVQVFDREQGYELTKNALKLIKIYVAKKRKVIVGDKMAGRHGNKGVISKIVPEEDLPYLEDGTTVDLILSPLSVPSRMNIGQILEANVGLAARNLNIRVITPSFNGATEKDVKKILKEAGLDEAGQFRLYDGRTGKPFDCKVTVGEAYFMKLNHLAEDKIHARSVGKYTLITQQPVGGKAQFGGQRLGEMEVWALEAYGASKLLQEMLTIKSDDLDGRKMAFEEISKGNTLFKTGIPESFNVLQRTLRGLALDLKALPEKKEKKKEEKKIETKPRVPVITLGGKNKSKEESNEG